MTRFGNRTPVRRRVVGAVLATAAAVAMITAFAPVTGHAQASQAWVCHVSGDANDIYVAPGVAGVSPPALWIFGQMMQVNERAVAAHVGHGDSATPHPVPFRPLLGGTYWTTDELFNLANFGNAWINVFEQGQFPNADCGIRYPILP